MSSLSDFFAEGGAPMYLVACTAVPAFGLALAALGAMASSTRALPLGLGASALLFGLVTVGLGVVGYLWGVQQVEEALAYVALPPDETARLRAQGLAEADNNLWLGGIASILPLAAGALAVLRGVTMKTEGAPPR